MQICIGWLCIQSSVEPGIAADTDINEAKLVVWASQSFNVKTQQRNAVCNCEKSGSRLNDIPFEICWRKRQHCNSIENILLSVLCHEETMALKIREKPVNHLKNWDTNQGLSFVVCCHVVSENRLLIIFNEIPVQLQFYDRIEKKNGFYPTNEQQFAKKSSKLIKENRKRREKIGYLWQN